MNKTHKSTAIFIVLLSFVVLLDCAGGRDIVEAGVVVEKSYTPQQTVSHTDGTTSSSSTKRILIIVGLQSNHPYEVDVPSTVYAIVTQNDTVSIQSRRGKFTNIHYFPQVAPHGDFK